MTEQTIELITRQQMAELAGVSVSKIHAAAAIAALNFPTERSKKRNEKLYDLAEFLAWLEKNPLKGMRIMGGLLTAATLPNKLDNGMAGDFMRGRYAPVWGRRAHGRRLEKARRRRPITQRVRVHEAQNAPKAPRADLARQTGEERPTLAAMAGRTFY
ncbi:MAG: hypothetical protein WC284_18245 [Candidimonas sp.]